MADKRMITAVIDSIEERLPDNDRGWGKYKVYLEGEKDLFQVDVPADVNAEYDLEEGFNITIVEGPYKGWICHSNSECFTGEPFETEPAQEEEDESPKRRGRKPTNAAASTTTAAKPRSRAYAKKDHSSENTSETRTAKPKSGASHTAWNQYQIDVRDPQMRMQTIIQLTTNIHTFAVTHEIDPSAMIDEIVKDAQRIDEVISKYLKV